MAGRASQGRTLRALTRTVSVQPAGRDIEIVPVSPGPAEVSMGGAGSRTKPVEIGPPRACAQDEHLRWSHSSRRSFHTHRSSRWHPRERRGNGRPARRQLHRRVTKSARPCAAHRERSPEIRNETSRVESRPAVPLGRRALRIQRRRGPFGLPKRTQRIVQPGKDL
jgi:hypothetical protein